jgi:chromosome segregation ATPase
VVVGRQGAEKEQQLTLLQARIRTMEESGAIASKEASIARVEGTRLLEQLKSCRGQLASSESNLANALTSISEMKEEIQSLRQIGQEKDRRLELLASAPSTQAVELHALQERTQQQAARLRTLEVERDAQRHAQQQSRLALEQLEAENRALRQQIEQLQRLTLASRPDDGSTVSELTRKSGLLASQLDDTRQALAEQRQVFTSLYESLETVILELGERMFALKKGYMRQSESIADREAVNTSVANIDRMMDEIQNAQGQLRGLHRLLNRGS